MIVCTTCGSPDWIACAPGTAPDAKSYDAEKITDIRPAEDVPTVAWCEIHVARKPKAISC